MDLPTGTLTTGAQQTLQIISRLFGGCVGTDVAGVESVTDDEQIHIRINTEHSAG